jgi:hypothetical protein
MYVWCSANPLEPLFSTSRFLFGFHIGEFPTRLHISFLRLRFPNQRTYFLSPQDLRISTGKAYRSSWRSSKMASSSEMPSDEAISEEMSGVVGENSFGELTPSFSIHIWR